MLELLGRDSTYRSYSLEGTGRAAGASKLTPRVRSVDPARKIRRVGRQPLLVPALMHPTLLPRPFHHDGWVYEEKIDGYRMVVYKEEDGVRLVSRNGRDHTRRFPELVKALGGLKPKTFT